MKVSLRVTEVLVTLRSNAKQCLRLLKLLYFEFYRSSYLKCVLCLQHLTYL